MKKIVIYGKGGIGKSTITTHLSIAFSKKQKKVLQIGCDPKHDSCKRLLEKPAETIMDLMKNGLNNNLDKEDYIFKGKFGIDCIEVGGPSAGRGCAGRGVSLMFELFEDSSLLENSNYDTVIFDVLGDVVCGGFASPLRIGFADLVYIVTSEEIMSLYATNNIASAVENYSINGARLGGIILNLKNNNSDYKMVSEFATKIGTKIIGIIPRIEEIFEAEIQNKTLFELDRDDISSKLEVFIKLSEDIQSQKEGIIPKSLTFTEFDEFIENFYKKGAI